MKSCKLYELIPKEKLDYLFANSDASCDLDYTFLGFEDVYKDVLQHVPKNKIIIDLGCGYAAQSYYFRDHIKYIGVDVFGNDDSVIHTDNSEFYFLSIQNFINETLPLLNFDLKDVFAICSYVPDNEARELVADTFPYCKVFYPGLPPVIRLPESDFSKPSLDTLICSAEAQSANHSSTPNTPGQEAEPEHFR